MKEYKFDYIRKMVLQWNPSMKVNLDNVLDTRFRVTLPLIIPEDDENGNLCMKYYPATDYYGEVIEDINDWLKQREKYCKKLVKELKKKKRKEIWKKLKF